MSSPTVEDEEMEEVEFVSEVPSRPVLECIDLLSDSEEGCSSSAVTLEDKVRHHKARVASTLDRLASQVAQEKKERADKCRAFKEKQIRQRVHGQQELAFNASNGTNEEAKRCVDMWLKMPGAKPGVVSSGFVRRRRSACMPSSSSTRHTCPVINCGRVYDNPFLLDGHLKRFDHSPCDPAITLKGCPSELFACVACAEYFQTKEGWRKHLESKVSTPAAGGHCVDQIYQKIVCFACPACYLLFNLRDECLQHMSAKNHFTESLAMNETRRTAMPVPVPQHAKNRLMALCKDSVFKVRCSLCHKVLMSHQEAQAHFNVHCRQGCAVAKADRTIVQIMKQLRVHGQCSLCCQIFSSQSEAEKHKESSQHDVEVNQTMAQALLQHGRFNGNQQSAKHSLDMPFQKRSKIKRERDVSPAKRKRFGPSLEPHCRKTSLTAWYCECGLSFPEEDLASKHLLAVNQIFHQCGVCGKLMGESSVTRLHMSRFHGGAHLSNFLFYCRKCKVEMPRYEDILSHVLAAHSGHTYFAKQEVPEELAAVYNAKSSKSSEVTEYSASVATLQQNSAETPSKLVQTWMCRMCEDVFDSKAAVEQHCGDVSSHSFQRFMCGHCPQKFFKESTVRRHCINEHNGQIKSFHFCGLCESMQFNSEEQFVEHYKSLHSKDYYCMEQDNEVIQPATAAAAQGTSQLTCPCMCPEKGKEKIKSTYTHCMRRLSAEGKCHYVCAPCSLSVQSYAQIKTHIHTKHTALNLEKTFDVECQVCKESFRDIPSFHKHYHCHHCTLEPCVSSKTCRKDVEEGPISEQMVSAMEIEPERNDLEIDDETMGEFIDRASEESESVADAEMEQALSLSAEEARRESVEFEEALQRSLLEF